MPICKSESIVLQRRQFRETSLIVDFYTRDFGRISGLLKGIRSDPNKFASSVEPFSYNDIIFYSRVNSGLHLVSQCDLKSNFDKIRQSISKVGISSSMMELLNWIMPAEEKNEDVFKLTIDSLLQLEKAENPDKILTIFKVKLLSFSGFNPHLDSCVVCNDKIFDSTKFSLVLGGLLCCKCIGRDTSARGIFRGTIASIIHIEKNEFKNTLTLGLNPEIKKELDAILNGFLNFHLGKQLKSERVSSQLKTIAGVT